MASVFDQLDPLAGALLGGLLNGLWQGAVLAALVWLVLRARRRTNATTRYAVWCVTLATIISLPLLAGLRAGRASLTHDAADAARAEAQAHLLSTRVAEVPQGTAALTDSTHSEQPAARASASSVAGPDTAGARGSALTIAAGRWALLLAGLYLLAAFWMVARVALSYARLRRLKREAVPLAGARAARLAELARACGVRRRVGVAASDAVSMPLAAGLGDAVILIPCRLVRELTDEEFEQVLLHELAHIRRYDDWTNLLQKLAEAVFFFHPAVRWVGSRLNLEREVACDDWVVWTTGERRPYATCLARLVELVFAPRPASLAPGAAVVRRHVFRRVELLLDRRRDSLPRLSRASCAVVLALLSAALLQSLRVPPVFAVSAGGRAAGLSAPASPSGLAVADARAESHGSEETRTGAAGSADGVVSADVTDAAEAGARATRGDADAAQESQAAEGRQEESRAEFERELQALMAPRVSEAEREMLAVMQPKIHEVEAEVHRLMQPKLDEVSRLEGEARRARERELQREVDLALGAKRREVERQINEMMEPRVREIEREARETLARRRRGGGL